MVTEDGKGSQVNMQPGKVRYHPKSREQEAEGEKDRSSFYYIYIQQNFAENNPYCTGQGHGWERHSPRWSGQEGSGLEEAQVLPQGSLGLFCIPVHGSQGATNHIPFFLTPLENLLSIGAVASE